MASSAAESSGARRGGGGEERQERADWWWMGESLIVVVVVGVSMKGRAVKLREAHKAGSPVFCAVVWGQGGQHVFTASATDVVILIHDATAVAAAGGRSSGSAAAAALSTIRLHKDGVTAVAVALLASGSIDHSVKFYSFPEE